MKKTLITLGVLLSLSCFAGEPSQQAPSADGKRPQKPAFANGKHMHHPPFLGGRYIIIINPKDRTDKYLLDTNTGKTWQYVPFGKNQGYWDAIPFKNYDSEQKPLPESYMPQ